MFIKFYKLGSYNYFISMLLVYLEKYYCYFMTYPKPATLIAITMLTKFTEGNKRKNLRICNKFNLIRIFGCDFSLFKRHKLNCESFGKRLVTCVIWRISVTREARIPSGGKCIHLIKNFMRNIIFTTMAAILQWQESQWVASKL